MSRAAPVPVPRRVPARTRAFALTVGLAVALALPGFPAVAAQPHPEWKPWLEALKAEAKKRGHAPATVAALEGLEPIPRVLELDRKQPEKQLTFDQYALRIITPERIALGRQMREQHRAALEKASRAYGVQPEYILAFWGMETRYGQVMGDYSVLAALATLAHDGRRSAFFRKELFAALGILDVGHVTPEAFKGSWAGAMGHCQFMPTTFMAYAVDGDGDGKRDIWSTPADVFASTANYLSKLKWKGKERWGLEVVVPEKLAPDLLGLGVKKPRAEWAALGVMTLGGKPLPQDLPEGSVVKPGSSTERTFLVFHNFRATLRWNRSQFFATGVGLVADGIAEPADALPAAPASVGAPAAPATPASSSAPAAPAAPAPSATPGAPTAPASASDKPR